MEHNNLFLVQLRSHPGSKQGQKGQDMRFSRKYEYFELEFCNYTLNCVGKLTVTQLTLENLHQFVSVVC